MNGTDTIERRNSASRSRQSAAARDQRRHPRYLTFRTGKIIADTREIECAVLDISAGGARLLAPRGTDIPKAFTLVVDPENSTFACRLAWSDGQTAGVTFMQATPPQSGVWLLDDARDRDALAAGAHGTETSARPGWSVKRSDRPIPKDNRRFARLLPTGPMSNAGTIVVDPDKPGIPCTIVDISANGVCLETRADRPIQETFTLIYDGIMQPCRVIWAKGHRIGASFAAREP